MGMTNLTKGTVVHKSGDTVETLEIVLKGKVVATDGDSEILLPSGSIIGLFEVPDAEYIYDYVTKEDVTIFSYSYQETADIAKVLKSNPKITPTLTSRTVKSAKDFYYAYLKQRELALKEYELISAQVDEYPVLCKLIGETPKYFEELENVLPPPDEEYIPEWQIPFLEAMIDHDALLVKSLPNLGSDIAVGITMTSVQFVETVIGESEAFHTYRRELRDITKNFNAERMAVATRANAVKNAGREGGEEIPEIKNAMDTILVYSGVSADIMSDFKNMVNQYKAHADRTETSDSLRQIRRGITSRYYEIYEGSFLKSMENPDIVPIEVSLFLMFGFIDEELVAEEHLNQMYRIFRTYTGDENGCVVTMYEWLKLIYEGKVLPSRNELDNDYPGYLRELKNNGEITAEDEKRLAVDMKGRFKFELNNMCTLANRMTFGRVTTFVPIFDSQNVIRPLERAFMSPEVVYEELDKIRAVDYSIFYRSRDYNNEAAGIQHFPVAKEILPYMILMPNVGSRMALWQEIEGKDRGTPGRMVIPIFMAEDISKAFVTMCGEYRWEMCKTMQGVHWNDITDPSLTAEYNDYIQCFKKNRTLTTDNKEKIKITLKKMGNNMKRVFVSDYMLYIQSESKGSPVMNKVSRGILFKYCPLEKSVRKNLSANPQYEALVTAYENQTAQKAHPIEMLIQRLESKKVEVPEPIREQLAFLQR